MVLVRLVNAGNWEARLFVYSQGTTGDIITTRRRMDNNTVSDLECALSELQTA
jgi:hypothetical protein